MNAGTSVRIPEKVPDMVSNGFELNKILESASKMTDGDNLQASARPIGSCLMETLPEMAEKRIYTDGAQGGTQQTLSRAQPTIRFPTGDDATAMENVQGTTHGKIKLNNFDLNNVYNDSVDCTENLQRSCAPSDPRTRPIDCALLVQQDTYKSSPPQTSATSDSTSARSLSTSSGEAQVYLLVLACLRFFIDTVMIMPLNSCVLGDCDAEVANHPVYVPTLVGMSIQFLKIG